MNWNNDKLNDIQQLEYQLLDNPSGSSPLFTSFIHNTSEWIDTYNPKEIICISPFKVEHERLVFHVAFHISCGYTVNQSIEMIGKNASDFRRTLTDADRLVILAARKQRSINKTIKQ